MLPTKFMAKTPLLPLLMMVPMLFAQTDTGALSGTISDPSGGAVANATVALENRATGLVRTTSTDLTGSYRFNLLAPGMYSISAQSQGFKRVAGNGVQIQVAREAELNLQLELGATAESVQVEAAASVLATESSAQGTVIGQEKISALPLNGRQFIQLALLVPGANSGGRQVQQNSVRLNQTGGISSSGGRTNNNAFLLDGAVNTDPDYNAISYVPILDTIAEFQV